MLCEVLRIRYGRLLSILKLPTKIGDIIYPLIDQEEGSPVIFRFKGKGTRPESTTISLIMYPLVSYQMVKISRSSGRYET